MTDEQKRYRDAWERYAAIWKLEGEQAKRDQCGVALAKDVVYTDPLTRRTGYDELVAYMLEFHQQVPGGHFVTQQFWAHHGRSVARWNMVTADGSVAGEGVSYAEHGADGKLTSMTGFFDPSAG